MSTSDRSSDDRIISVLILGSGPAGLTAGLYAARAELNPFVVTGMEIGGQVATTDVIENYPGFPDGIGGAELSELFKKQAERFGAHFEFDSVSSVDLSSNPFKVNVYGGELLARTLIVATGASPNHLDIPGESNLTGKGVSYCATCDGWFFKEKDVVVVGGGDSALEEGIFLTRFAKSVSVIHRRDELRAGKLLQRRARENPKISFVWDTVVEEIIGSEAVEGVRVRNVKTGEEKVVPTDGVFIFAGHVPNTEFIVGQVELDEKGYIITDKYTATSIPGVFASGEVADPFFRQVITSSGTGAASAIAATRFLEDNQ